MKNIHLVIEDEVLSGLIKEQLVRTGISADGSQKADMIIADQVTSQALPHLLIGARHDDHDSLSLPLRLGEMTDHLRYLLSGRDRFAAVGEIGFRDFSLAPDGVIRDEKSGKSLRLTEKEKLILQILYQADGHALDRKNLLHMVWGYAENTETHTLETHLYRLRQKLEEGFGSTDLIVTRDGIYSLNI